MVYSRCRELKNIEDKKGYLIIKDNSKKKVSQKPMGAIEQDVAKRVRRSKIQRAIIEAVAAAGVLSVALVAPNALQLLGPKGGRRKNPTDPEYAAKRVFRRLVQEGYLILVESSVGTVARLTPKGERTLDILHRPGVTIKKPKRWDKKWRVLIFDIQEDRRHVRDKLRTTLEHVGFICLQRSVWVYPYDCEDLIMLLKADFKIGKEILYIVADRIENDRQLRHHFSLS